MPIRSSATSVLKWPDVAAVRGQLRTVAEGLAVSRPELVRVGYIGSYARGDWGVGSDLDVVVEVASSDVPFERRAASFDFTGLPVPAEVLVYTSDELRQQLAGSTRFAGELAAAEWVFRREPA